MTSDRPQHVAIVGSRTYSDPRRVIEYVLSLPPSTVIVSGGAKGVDSWAETTARMVGMKRLIHRPRVRPHTSYATVCKERNSRIVASADRIVAFYNGVSPGTADTIEKAQATNKDLLIIDEEGEKRFLTPLSYDYPRDEHNLLDTTTEGI